MKPGARFLPGGLKLVEACSRKMDQGAAAVVKRLKAMGMIAPAQINNKHDPDATTKMYIDTVQETKDVLEDHHVIPTLSRLQRKLLQMNIDQPSILFGRFTFGILPHALEVDSGDEVLRFDLPLTNSSLDRLKTHCTDSLVGLGGAPFHDRHLPGIRSCLELDAKRVKGPPILSTLDFPALLDHIRERLVPTAPGVKAKLHKLLVYPEGAFFKAHVDTVQDEDHFGTLSLPLPCESPSIGGAVCYYQGRAVDPSLWNKYTDMYSNCYHERASCPDVITCDFNAAESWGAVGENREGLVPFVAWLTDIPHAILPVEKGHRVVLVYKLFKTGGSLEVPINHALTRSLRKTLDEVADLPNYVVRGVGIVCRHSYPQAALHPRNLKLVDTDVYSALTCLGATPELVSVVEMRSALAEDSGLRWAFPQNFLAEYKVWMRPRDKRLDFPEYDLDMVYGGGFDPDVFDHRLFGAAFQEMGPSACLQRMVFFHLGCGRMVAEGSFYYGNETGSSHWWYQHLMMVVPLDAIRRWKEVRGAVLSAVHEEGLPLLRNLHQKYPHIFKQICRELLQHE